MEKVILTLTTVPDRLSITKEGWGPKPGIEKLLKLSYPNYEVHFNIPYFNKKTGQQYIIPDWLKNLESENNRLKIYRTDDYGPATKLVPTLMRFNEDEDLTIISVEDDLVYMDGFIEYHLETRKKYPESIFGFAGISAFNNKCHLCTTCEDDIEVRILESYKTISYKRNFFKSDFFSDFVGKTWNDDVLISAYFGKHNRDKIVLRYSGDTDFRARVESFPIELVVPNNNSGCFLYRTESVSDNYDYFDKLGYFSKKTKLSKTTIVTGLWDFEGYESESQNGEIYLSNIDSFNKLLDLNLNLVIFGDEKTENLVWEKRKKENTQFILRNFDWFKNEFFERIQKVRKNLVVESENFLYEMYSPIELCKIFLLNDSKILNVFNSDYVYWVDSKIMKLDNVNESNFESFFKKLSEENDKFIFTSDNLIDISNIDGFPISKIYSFLDTSIDMVVSNLFFGGPIHTITDINFMYYNLLSETLNQGLMGSDKSLFTILLHKNSSLINYIQIPVDQDFNQFINTPIESYKNNTNQGLIDDPKIEETAIYFLLNKGESEMEYPINIIGKNNNIKKYLVVDDFDLSQEIKKLCMERNIEILNSENNLESLNETKIVEDHFSLSDKNYMLLVQFSKK
jgi:hypothetical protein